MKRSFWLALFIVLLGISMAGCACLGGEAPSWWFKCGQAKEEAPPPQPAVVKPAPPPPAPAPQPAPPLKQDRN
jgi:hypothetical protein